MEENKSTQNNLVFSSIHPNTERLATTPEVAINNAFKEEQIRQTQEIPVEQIKQAASEVVYEEPVQQPVQPQPVVPEVLQQPAVEQVQPVQQEPIEQPKVKEKKHMKKSAKVAIILIIVLVVSLTLITKFISFINNPKYISKKALVDFKNETLDIIKLPKNTTLIGDTFNIESTLKTSLGSKKVLDEYQIDPKMNEYFYLISNFNNTTTKINLQQDINNKKLFFNRQTIKDNNVVIDDKYLIENSTEYYFVKNYFENYINDGNNNYFETITEDRNASYNIKYIYKVIVETISNNIDKEDYNVTNTTTYINNKTENVKKVSIKLDNVKLRKVINKTLNNLKKDKVSFNILNGVIDDFENYKLTAKDKIIGTKETLNINFYTQGFLNETKKYEVSIVGPKESKGITFEKDYKNITYIENNKAVYYISYKMNKYNLNVVINDKNNKKLATLSFDNTDERKHLTIEFEKDDLVGSIDANYKVTDKKDKSYKSTTKILVNIKNSKTSVLNGNIDIETTVNNKVKIEEDINDVTFGSEITEEKRQSLKTLLETRMKKQL